MKKTTIARALPFALLTLAGGQASAAGFQLLEQNASGLGNAYAGSAAVADNASTIFFNPAGMTQLQAREVSAGISAVRPTFKFTDRGSSVGALAGSGTGGDAGSWAFIPNAYLSWALDKDLYVGVGISAPFGLVTEYDKPWLGAAQAVKFDIKTININPSIAYRVNEKVSLGFGLNWQRMEAEYTRVAAVASAATTGTNVTLDASDDSVGWNVGALFTLSERTTLGVSYRSKMKHTLTGDIRVDGTLAGVPPLFVNGPAKAEVELPDVFIFSVAQRLSDRWEMLGDVSWTGWSSIQKINIVRTSTGAVAQTLDADFRDTWRIALGANYKLNDAWKLKFGVAYDQTPVTGPGTRLVSLPDSNRTWLTAGAQWQVSPASKVDMGVAYLHIPETSINNNQAASGRGTVTGVYDARVWILGAQYSMAF
ncbi:MAG: outer membrane protein transport protein [Rhodocyclaceae bacterium]|nr:outer membrane protein transport protein [Rhodocyclaceae bacterium]MCB1962275.1 outer membrane protein transport protein [Rhodocyclaceae bacterium]